MVAPAVGCNSALPKSGFRAGFVFQLLTNAFKLAAAYVLQVLALRRLRSRLVQVNGHLIALPYFFADPPGNGHAVFQRQTFDRDERNHVGRAQPRMRSRVFGEVNKLGGFADAANGSLGNVHRVANERNDTAVMVGVHLAVEQIDAVHLHGCKNGIDTGLIAPFGKVRHTFYECGHKRRG